MPRSRSSGTWPATDRRSPSGSEPRWMRPASTSSSSSPCRAGPMSTPRTSSSPSRSPGFRDARSASPAWTRATPGRSPNEFERAVTTHGLRGLKISPTYQAIDPRSPECWRLYEIADAHRTPVMFHCGGAYTGSLEWADPCLLDKVAMAFPDLKLVVAPLRPAVHGADRDPDAQERKRVRGHLGPYPPPPGSSTTG